MNPVEVRWQQLRDTLIIEIAARPNVICRIPDWEPVDMEMGLRWLQSTIYEGYYVAYRITDSSDGLEVWFKYWEFGELAPVW